MLPEQRPTRTAARPHHDSVAAAGRGGRVAGRGSVAGSRGRVGGPDA